MLPFTFTCFDWPSAVFLIPFVLCVQETVIVPFLFLLVCLFVFSVYFHSVWNGNLVTFEQGINEVIIKYAVKMQYDATLYLKGHR